MAQVSYNDFVSSQKQYDVEFFTIKPNSEALVRIMCDKIDDLEILTVHPVRVGNANFDNKNVNCLRNPKEPLEQCPLCAAGVDVRQRVFIKMIQYDEATHEAKAVVWDRSAAAYVPTLKKYLDNYGPLSNIFCKISRTGEGLDTKYDIIPNVNPGVYNDANFPRKDNAFDDFNVLGSMVMDKNAMEMAEYVRTGNFPQREDGPTVQTAPQAEPVQYSAAPNFTPVPDTPAVAYQPTPEPIPNAYTQPYPATPTESAAPVDKGGMERPQRYY